MIDAYIKKVAFTTKRGDAREESYYPALAELLENFSETQRHKKVHVTVLPKKTEAGNPDFRVWDGKHSQVGYVEGKPPHANLDDIETSDQLKRYISTFPNLILTNFYEFRLFRNGQRVDNVLLARPYISTKLKAIPPAEHTREFLALLEKFFQFSLPTKFSAESLAKELATRTRFLRDQVIKEELREASSAGAKKILGFYEAFQKHLIANLKPDEFADLYAQTVTYGLFAARTRANGAFNRKLAYDLIPKTIGILRDIFHFISFDPPEQLQATVDDIAEVLAVADVKKILHQYFKEGKGTDPIFHFYETFLAEYNPQERERRGVYYTPEPVVSYIVRSLNIILKETFGRQDGFATHCVTVLDPAGGTLTFLAEAAKLAVHEFVAKYGEGSKGKFIEDHILKHFFAFELMMAPYAAGHLKMGYLMEELGHKLSGDERFQFYLTNTLEMEELAQTSLPGMASLSQESYLAGEVKKEKSILVVLGNPPYSVSSSNKSEFIEKAMELYKQDVKKERNIQPLSDDYIKFIRFAHWKIERAGVGVIGFITNNSYLSGLIHRGMRKRLLESFSKIYVLNLHGNSRLGEKSPDGSTDENVFDIMQGVSIALFVRDGKGGNRPGRVFYQDLYGTRKVKYKYLNRHDLNRTKWVETKPSEPEWYFLPMDYRVRAVYSKFPSIRTIFNEFSFGVTTHRDHFVVGFIAKELKDRIRTFTSDLPDDIVRQTFNLDETVDWKLKEARKRLAAEDWSSEIIPYAYRTFDKRVICYTRNLIDRDRRNVMENIVGVENIGLNVARRLRDPLWQHAFVTDCITDKTLLSSRDNAYFVPLYLYQDSSSSGSGGRSGRMSYQAAFVFEPQADYSNRKPNLNPKLISSLKETFRKQPTPEMIFYYIYAVLYSNAYRKKYAESLRTDFPRVPFTKDYKLFQKLAGKGSELVKLHLLKSKKLAKPIAKCEGSGDLRVVKVSYDAKKDRVYINPDKYFAGVPSEVWEYHIGGYQVAEKWLKDRKDRIVSSEEIATYANVITAIAETINIQDSLDDLFKEVELSILEVSL
jgi:predicted helicase